MSQSAKWFMDVSDKIFAGMGARTDTAFNQFFEENGLEGRAIAFVQIAGGQPQFREPRPYECIIRVVSRSRLHGTPGGLNVEKRLLNVCECKFGRGRRWVARDCLFGQWSGLFFSV